MKLDRWLLEGHLAREISQLVDDVLALVRLFSSYPGRGSKPHRLDLMLYEHQIGRSKPAQWWVHLKENKVAG